MSIDLSHDDLQGLYGDTFYVLPGDKNAPKATVAEEKPAPAEPVTTTEPAAPTKAEPAPEPKEASPANPETTPPTQEKPMEDTGTLVWRPKPTSQVLFILHQEELRNKELTDLLKKIVQSIEIPFEAAGFGIVTGVPELRQFHGMPNPYGVVFDHVLNPTGDNPVEVEGGKLYYTHRLAELQDNQEYKRALWEHLKTIKSLISK